MNPHSAIKKSPFALAALSASFKKSLGAVSLALLASSLLAACQDSAGPSGETSVQADLKELAAKVQTFGAPGRSSDGPAEKRSALAKRTTSTKSTQSAKECWNGSLDGVSVFEEKATEEYPVYYLDTTWYHTAAGTLACEQAETIAYEVSHVYSKDAKTEWWMTSRLDYGTPADDYAVKYTATGKVRYFSGYDIEVKSMVMTSAKNFSISEYKMVLGLEKGKYTVTLGLAASLGIDDVLTPDTVVLSGAILKGAATVGYFEIMGDDRVVIRDEARNIVAAH